MLTYTENGEKKRIKLGSEAIHLQERSSESGFTILYNAWKSMKENSFESKVFHDLIYYLKKGNHTRQSTNKTKETFEECFILPADTTNKNISGQTTVTGATIYLINRLKRDDKNTPAVHILSNILSGMLNTTFFTKKKKNGTHNIEYKLEEEISSFALENESFKEYPDEVENKYIEGSFKTVTVNAYERSKKARNKCIDHYGVNCMVCNFNFANVYGSLGEGFIHVHHLKPLSEIEKEYKVDPINDLRPVCPNCHAMLHRKGNISIHELTKGIEKLAKKHIKT